jgi:hypothetical protein
LIGNCHECQAHMPNSGGAAHMRRTTAGQTALL